MILHCVLTDFVGITLLTTLFLSLIAIGVAAIIPFGRLMLLLLGLVFLVSTLGAWLVAHHVRSTAYSTVVVCSSLFSSYTGTATDALCQLYFFISILILALYSFILREVTKREPVLFPALPWTASRPWTMIFP